MLAVLCFCIGFTIQAVLSMALRNVERWKIIIMLVISAPVLPFFLMAFGDVDDLIGVVSFYCLALTVGYLIMGHKKVMPIISEATLLAHTITFWFAFGAVLFREEEGHSKVSGVVINWSPVEKLGLFVDPLSV